LANNSPIAKFLLTAVIFVLRCVIARAAPQVPDAAPSQFQKELSFQLKFQENIKARAGASDAGLAQKFSR
jgi:hypothetical protein